MTEEAKKQGFYKTVDLFGNEAVKLINKDKKQANLFSDYDAFVDKFEAKKTTDDCYTPPEVYQIVLDYVNEKYSLDGVEIVRPFYPGGDYQSIEYGENSVVIDNPPFSIITQICRFYIERNIKFFLFCPHLTAFGSDIDCSYVIPFADITYENGAKVKTAFATNLLGDIKILGDANLAKKFDELNQRNKANLPKYRYPDNIITVSKIAYCVLKGVSIEINKADLLHYKQMDAQKAHKKALFGSGFICSDNAASKLKQATAQATAQAAADDNVIEWPLSEREKEIIKSLNANL